MIDPMTKRLSLILTAMFFLAASAGGCGFFDEHFGTDDGKKQTAKKTTKKSDDKKNKQANPTVLPTSVALDLGAAGKVATSECFVQLLPTKYDLPAILRITSYANPKSESFPSVMIQANAPADDLKSLIDQSIEAKVFVQNSPDGPVWETLPEEPALVTIKNVDDSGRIVGSISSATLISTTGTQTTTAAGTFDGKTAG